MADDPWLGVDLDGYRLDVLIGRGGTGVVYRATQLRLGRLAAVKLLAGGLAADEEFRRRFEREARLAASLEHPHIVPLYDAGYARDVLYLAMRYVDGPNLATLIDTDGPLDLGRVCGLLAGVAQALDAAHRAGLVHRDVKPANLLTARIDQHAYLCDFGIAQQSSSSSALTSTGQFLGTLRYCAPEQIRGHPIDGRADQYALACVAYYCLIGRPPFPAEDLAAVMFAHVSADPPRPSTQVPDLPASVDDVLARALAKDPTHRYPDCVTFISALSAGAAGTAAHMSGADPRRPAVSAATPTASSIATTLVWPPREPGTGLAPAPPSASPEVAGRWWASWSRRTRWLVGGAGALVLMSAGTLVWAGLTASRGPGPLPAPAAPAKELPAPQFFPAVGGVVTPVEGAANVLFTGKNYDLQMLDTTTGSVQNFTAFDGNPAQPSSVSWLCYVPGSHRTYGGGPGWIKSDDGSTVAQTNPFRVTPAVSLDGRFIVGLVGAENGASASDSLESLDTLTGQARQLMTLSSNADPEAVVSPDDKRVYISDFARSDHTVQVVDLASGAITSIDTGDDLSQVAIFGISPDGQRLYGTAAESDHSGQIVEMSTSANRVEGKFDTDLMLPVGAAAVSPSGNYIFVVADGDPPKRLLDQHLEIFDAHNGRKIAWSDVVLPVLTQLQESPDGGRLYAAEPGPSGGLHVFNVADFR